MVSNAKRKVEKTAKPNTAGEPDTNVGHALRSVYTEVADEAVPQEMLDLLGKLK